MDENLEPDDDLLCGVCERILNDPHTLICGHAFCKEPCLSSLHSVHGYVRCPFCFIEVEAASVVADSVLAGRLRQYFIKKCRARPTDEMNVLTGDFALLSSSDNMIASPSHSDSSQGNKEYKKSTRSNPKLRPQRNISANVTGSTLSSTAQGVPLARGQPECRAAPAASIESAQADPIGARKIFVGGLNRQVTNEALRKQFARFGNVTDAIVIRDRKTGVSMGYGYVTFELPRVAEAVLAEPKHEVCGSYVEVKKFQKPKRGDLNQDSTAPATRTQQNASATVTASALTSNTQSVALRKGPTECQTAPVASVASPLADPLGSRKIFVGGLNRQVTNEALRTQFARFGNVTDAIVIRDRKTGVSMGYGYVTFELPSVAEAVLAEPKHQVCGSYVDVKKFQKPKRGDVHQDCTAPATNNPYSSFDEECETLHPLPMNVGSPSTPCKVSAADKPMTRIYVGHLRPYITRAQLMQYFCKYGKIEHVFVAKQKDTHASLGFGFVQFADASAVKRVLTSGPHNIRNAELVIRPVREGGTQANDSYEGSSMSPSDSPLVSRSASPSGQSVVKATPPVQKIHSRCPNWLACSKGGSCPYGHPSRDCNNKRCNRGPQCCFLHPEDKILLENLRNRINLPAVTARAISNNPI